jgi:hypothetical protein
MHRLIINCLILSLLALLCQACQRGHGGGSQTGAPRDATAPSAPVPLDNSLVRYDKLKLGMSELELSQVYNAPDGKGDGFTRVLQRFDAVSVHTIEFDVQPGQPARKLLLEFYRDQLCRIVDRQDGLSAQQAEKWLAGCRLLYGPPAAEPIPGGQWSWGAKDGVLLTYTQDNASSADMSANVVVVHNPTLVAAQAFLQEWEAAHPQKPAARQ